MNNLKKLKNQAQQSFFAKPTKAKRYNIPDHFTITNRKTGKSATFIKKPYSKGGPRKNNYA